MRKLNVYLLGLLLLAGCAKLAPKHPNQLNDFDGYAYDTLIVAQGSLEAAKVEYQDCEASASPASQCALVLKAKEQLNQAIASFNAAHDIYVVYHGVGDKSLQLKLEQLLADALRDIGALQSAFGRQL